MKRWIISFLTIWMICALLGSHSAPAIAQDAGGSVYISLGDSLAAGLGSSLPRERGYAALVADWLGQERQANVTLVNIAQPGETVASFRTNGQLERFREETSLVTDADLDISAISLSLGGNAILGVQHYGLADRQAALDQFSTDYPALLQEIRDIAGNAPLVVTNVYDPTEGDPAAQYTDSWWIAQFNQVISQAAESVDAQVADIAAAFEGQDDLTYYPLDVHPTNEGHRVIAQSVFAAIGLDTTPPDIAIDAPETATRNTPTVTITIDEATELQATGVELSDGWLSPVIEIDDGKRVVLLDLAGVNGDSVTLTVTATDVAGNTTETDVSIGIPR